MINDNVELLRERYDIAKRYDMNHAHMNVSQLFLSAIMPLSTTIFTTSLGVDI